jgi:tetratricopeptide (TPR) repeat protein
MTKTLVLTMACLLMGCKTLPSPQSSSESVSLSDAEKMLEAGEVFRAKSITHKFLEEHPEDFEAVQLMGRILDEEISLHKEAFENALPEDLTPDERQEQVKTLMERGKSLLEIGEYDQAAMTIESVFQYDPDNAEASALLDSIKNEAITTGKKEMADQTEIVQSETDVRVGTYRRQARKWLEEGKLGAARLAVEKILMLKPEDEEALELLKTIKAQRHD